MRDTVKHSALIDSHYLTVTEPSHIANHCNQISISFDRGTGSDMHKTDRAQVAIWIESTQIFTGTFEELKGTIDAGNEMERGGIVINGYIIRYNSYWKAYQASHTTSDEIGQWDFATLQQAINYAING